MVKIVKKEIKITGKDNDFDLTITNVKEKGAVVKITEQLNAEELTSSLNKRAADYKACIDNINRAREELRFYEVPKTVEGLYEIFKVLMNLNDKRKDELKTGIKNLEMDRDQYDSELAELRSAYKRAKSWIVKNRAELVSNEEKVE